MYNFLILICVIYCCLFFLDFICRTCKFNLYTTALNACGIKIKFFHVTWTTTYFNRLIIRTSSFKFLHSWFQAGACMWVFSLPATFFLLFMIFEKLPVSSSSRLPIDDFLLLDVVYSVPALFVSQIVHKFGHALAASREKVSVENVGITVYGVFPIAFVNLSKEQLAQLHPKQQLPIYCAGIWHNLVLLILCILLMCTSLIFVPPIQQGKGVTVVDIEQSSGAAKLGGFLEDDVIVSANDCQIEDPKSYRSCLENIFTSRQGFCSSKEFIKESFNTIGGNVPNCCTNSSGHFCFEIEGVKEYAYLSARKLNEDLEFCHYSKDCSSGVCLIPAPSLQSERLVKFHTRNKTSVIYVGSIEDIYSSIQVTRMESRFKLLHGFKMFFIFLFSINVVFIFINLIPNYICDGEHIIAASIHLYFSGLIRSPSTRNCVIETLKLIAFLLLIWNSYLEFRCNFYLDLRQFLCNCYLSFKVFCGF